MVRMVDLIKKNGEGKSASAPAKSPSGESGGFSLASPQSREQAPAQRPTGPAKIRAALRGNGGGGDGSLGTPTSLVSKTKYCPNLGGRKDRAKIIDYPSSRNVCHGRKSHEKKFLRTVILPFSIVPAQRQREFCLATYRRCPFFQILEKEKAEKRDDQS